MKSKLTLAILCATLVLGAAGPATATNLVTNGGFENGSTNGNGNYNIPNNWTPNTAFTAYMSNGAIAINPHTGFYALAISNLDTQPLASLSQTFSTVVGGLYTANFYFDPLPGVQSDPNAFLRVSAGKGSVTLPYNTVAASYAYALSTFNFVGTGSDTLTISAQSNANRWLVDDVSVTGGAPAPGAVPEPASWAMMLAGFGLVGSRIRRRADASITVA